MCFSSQRRRNLGLCFGAQEGSLVCVLALKWAFQSILAPKTTLQQVALLPLLYCIVFWLVSPERVIKCYQTGHRSVCFEPHKKRQNQQLQFRSSMKSFHFSLLRPSTGTLCSPRRSNLRSCRPSKSRRTSVTLTATSLASSPSCRRRPNPSSSPPSSRKPSPTSTSAPCTGERGRERDCEMFSFKLTKPKLQEKIFIGLFWTRRKRKNQLQSFLVRTLSFSQTNVFIRPHG